MFAEQMREKMEVFVCLFEVKVEDQVQKRTLEAPRIMLEQEFMSLVNEAANSNLPISIKMSRKVPIFDQFDQRWIERENSIVFTNEAYNRIHQTE